uniref:Uncharacterized protein n=1 Tax=Anguilla anguilla TaxID=7936 RepID=A0A0E9WD62_ANGAN
MKKKKHAKPDPIPSSSSVTDVFLKLWYLFRSWGGVHLFTLHLRVLLRPSREREPSTMIIPCQRVVLELFYY